MVVTMFKVNNIHNIVFNVDNLLLHGRDDVEEVFDHIAQQVEHYTFNVRVLGSNPNVVTNDTL